MATITLMPDGMLRIVGETLSDELLAEIKDRIGPEEAAVVVPAGDIVAFLENSRAEMSALLERHRALNDADEQAS